MSDMGVRRGSVHEHIAGLPRGSEEPRALLLQGDALEVLKELPDDYAQTSITSPPYWSLRDYGIPGQIGLEESLEAYLDSLLDVFEQVRRVTRPDGTLWLNIGDSYTSGGRTWRAPDKKHPVRAMSVRPPTPDGLKPKDLIGVPWRLALELQRAGWFLRADIVWHKPNAMPESVRDRPTIAHEYVFFFSKSKDYKYDRTAVTGPGGRNLRSVWDIHTRALPDAHFATFPEELVEIPLLLTSEPGDVILDPFAGSGTSGVVALPRKRHFVGIELNPDYLEIAERRIARAAGQPVTSTAFGESPALQLSMDGAPEQLSIGDVD